MVSSRFAAPRPRRRVPASSSLRAPSSGSLLSTASPVHRFGLHPHAAVGPRGRPGGSTPPSAILGPARPRCPGTFGAHRGALPTVRHGPCRPGRRSGRPARERCQRRQARRRLMPATSPDRAPDGPAGPAGDGVWPSAPIGPAEGGPPCGAVPPERGRGGSRTHHRQGPFGSLAAAHSALAEPRHRQHPGGQTGKPATGDLELS